MNVIRVIALILSLLLSHALLKGQDYYDLELKPKMLKKTALHAIRKNDHYTAIAYLEKYLATKETDKKMAMALADQYRIIRYYSKAVYWYEQAYELDPDDNLLAQFYKAKMEMNLEHYEEALALFTEFRRKYRGKKDESLYRKLSKIHTQGCEKAIRDSLPNQSLFVDHINNGVNRAYNEISPYPLSSDRFIYATIPSDTVLHHKDTAYADTAILKMRNYLSQKKGEEWELTGFWDQFAQEDEYHYGNVVFNQDRSTLYFTKCRKNWKYQMICHIYQSKLNDGIWSEPEQVEALNEKKYTSTQPTVGMDAKTRRTMIYFVSDRPGGKGGSDIWYSILRKGEFTEPRNCGSRINSPADEVTPYFDIESNSMYFSSDGIAGYGGLDIYRSFGQKSKWVKVPEHLPKPINSSADDLYFINGTDPKWGFFTSNREGGIALKHPTCCDDIYQFEYDEFRRFNYRAMVRSEDQNTTVENASADVYIRDESSGDTTYIKTVKMEDGHLNVNVERGLKYRIVIKAKDHFRFALDIPTDDDDIEFQNTDTVRLKKITKDAIVLKNIYYDFDDWRLTQKAKHAIDSFLLQVLQLNPEIKVEISSHTDAKGSATYNVKLSQKRAESVVNYLKSKGILRSRMVAKGYGKSKPIAPNTNPDGSDNPEGRQLNRRTEFRVIGYQNRP